MEDIERIPYLDDLPAAAFDVSSLRDSPAMDVNTACLSPLLALLNPHPVGGSITLMGGSA